MSKTLYNLFNTNMYGIRSMTLSKLEKGIKGIKYDENNREIDLRHIDILKNWETKSKEERLSFINDIDTSSKEYQQGMDLVLSKSQKLKEGVKGKLKSFNIFKK